MRQPSVHDVRFVMMAAKLTTDLERMGDLVSNIAEEIAFLCEARDIRHQHG